MFWIDFSWTGVVGSLCSLQGSVSRRTSLLTLSVVDDRVEIRPMVKTSHVSVYFDIKRRLVPLQPGTGSVPFWRFSYLQ
jgi:hypothetical protein